uniref:Uncharacterized protein n=1 Tax=Opuntia streptacantha TaxID=393608 RepID=A0A7C9CGN6_OPUST
MYSSAIQAFLFPDINKELYHLGERNGLRKRLVCPKQTLVCGIPTENFCGGGFHLRLQLNLGSRFLGWLQFFRSPTHSCLIWFQRRRPWLTNSEGLLVLPV